MDQATRVPANALIVDTKNANKGTARGRALLAESLRSHGAGRSILIDRRGRIIAGNKTFEQSRSLGLPVRIVTTNGRELIAVQRRDLDLERDPGARALAVRDNRVAELDLEWDVAALEAVRQQGLDLGSLWTEDEWAALTGEADSNDPAADAVLEPGPTTIRRGDLFALGRHRLLCGDATDAGDVARLLGGTVPVVMCTDPPYGVRYDPGWRHQAYPGQRTAVGKVRGDDQASWPAAFRLFPGDVIYAWHAGQRAVEAANALTDSGFAVRAQIIWVKSHFALSRGQYHWSHEPCYYAVRRGGDAHWRGDRTQTTVWEVPNLNPIGGARVGENAPTGHGTQKPVRLFETPILNHTKAGDGIYDPFVGSGTALIAAEKTQRIGFAMDLDPQYVQVAVNRWQAFTGERATPIRPAGRRRS